jgi:hypothetical protein
VYVPDFEIISQMICTKGRVPDMAMTCTELRLGAFKPVARSRATDSPGPEGGLP